MPDFIVVIQPEAEQDIDEAYNYLEGERQGLGFEFLADLAQIIEMLETSPKMFQVLLGNKRRAVIRRFKYSVIYLIRDKTVYILAVFHSSRDFKL